MVPQTLSPSLKMIEEQWSKAWADALADWSPYVQLREPTWCYTPSDEAREGLTESFAMIRLKDHSVVISIKQIQEHNLESFPHEILAHEIGHHVLCPADLTDNARLIARVRRGLPEVESYAPYISNLYADLLINDRLQRFCNRRLDLVYQSLKSQEPGGNLWMLYMRIYESLWNLEPETLTSEKVPARMNQDAILGARLVRVYAKDWLQGAGRFACLCYPYVVVEQESKGQRKRLWCDTLLSGGNHLPNGLTEIEDDELLGTIHPVEDPELSGLPPIERGDIEGNGRGRTKGNESGRKSIKQYRGPMEYLEILNAAGVDLPPREIAVRYYRERALPYLIPFPVRIIPQMSDPLPEGLDLWDPDSRATHWRQPRARNGEKTHRSLFGCRLQRIDARSCNHPVLSGFGRCGNRPVCTPRGLPCKGRAIRRARTIDCNRWLRSPNTRHSSHHGFLSRYRLRIRYPPTE
jgi:hypothetical protein